VLALLLTRANEVVAADTLIEALWSGEPPRTATNTLQHYVSQLRKAIGADRIVTRAPGYLVRVDPGELDLERFQRLVEEGGAEALRSALGLWRGPALADFTYEPFVQAEVVRLEELRLTALEERIDADLALGHHNALVGELEACVAAHPLRERLRGQLMLALYRSGRQAEALEAYQRVRRTLVDELGIEPGPALQRLERAILRQDPALDLEQPPARSSQIEEPLRAIVVAPREHEQLDALLSLAEPLAGSRPAREVIVACITSADGLAAATALANDRRAALTGRGVAARAAAFTSAATGDDVVRIAVEQDVDLLLLDWQPSEDVLAGDLAAVLAGAPCDVGLLSAGGARVAPGADRPVLVPFGGAEHEWTAVEVAAWIAASTGARLKLVGAEGDAARGKRDASRLLASASLLVQRAVGVTTEPLLAAPGAAGILGAADTAGLIVGGLSGRWRREGVGETRLAIARGTAAPFLIVRRGPGSGGLAQPPSLTRFTWSVA
jgi:DNA-binding SARP family transcriptional activator